MIWQLMRLDPAWRLVGPTTLVFGTLDALWHLFPHRGGVVAAMPFAVVFVFWLIVVSGAPLIQQSETRFQATLPVTVREVFAARVLSMCALLWVPAGTAAIMLIVLRDAGVSDLPLRTWSVVTCIVLGLQCGGIRGLTMRLTLPLIALPVSAFVLSLVVVTEDWPFRNSFAWDLAVFGCWMMAAAAIVHTWRVVPMSFQLARAEPLPADPSVVADHPARSRGAPSRSRGAPWKPVLKTIFPLLGLEYLFYFLAMCIMGSPLGVYFVVMSSQNWISYRAHIRWLFALPVRSYALLAALLLPGILSLAGGYLAGIYLRPILRFMPIRALDTGLRTQIVTVTFIAGWSLLANLCALAGDSHRVRRVLPSGYWSAVFALLFMMAGLALIASQALSRFEPVPLLSSKLPASPGGTIAVSVVVLGALLWALDAMFGQVEFADKPGPPGV